MISIHKLIWDSWNVAHSARHEVTPDEVEAEVYYPVTARPASIKERRLYKSEYRGES